MSGADGVADPLLSADGEVSLARLALGDGDLTHAARHAARALTTDPTLPAAYALVVELARRADGGPDLFAPAGPTTVGTVVARAHALAATGDPAAALDLLALAQRHEPAGAWAAVPWLADAALPARLPPDHWFRLVGVLIGAVDEPADDGYRAAFAPWLAAVRGAVDAYPGQGRLAWAASILARRLGHHADAVTLAELAERREPSEQAAIALGYAYRAQGRYDDAERAWLRALHHAPDNLAVYSDMAEMLAEAGRLDDGIDWAERALATDPTHDCAAVVRSALRYRRDADVDHLVGLADRLRTVPGDVHEARHADQALATESAGRPWLGYVPAGTEAVLSVLRQVLADPDAGAQIDLTVSAPEPPSALLACARALPGLAVTIGDVPSPDPRHTVPEVLDVAPVRAVFGRVWGYHGRTAHPVPAPAGPDSVAAVTGLVHRWRHLPAAYDEAVRLAGVPLPDLLGMLVHPPEPPTADPGVWPDWIRLIQAWACLGIAHHRVDEPWPRSVRRATLVDLAYGPEDWVSEAALLALVATAWMEPDVRRDVAELVAWRLVAAGRAAQTRAVTILGSLAALALATPDLDPRIRDLAADLATREAP